MTRRQALVLGGLTLLMLGLVAWLARVVDLDEALHAFATVRLGPLPWLGVAFVVLYAVRIARFGVLLGPGVPLRPLVLSSLAGYFAVTVLPLRLGELARPLLLARVGVPLEASVAAVVVERLFDLAALLALLVWIGVAVPLPGAVVVEGIDVLAAGQQAVALAGGVGLTGLVVVGLVGASARGGSARGGLLARFAAAVRTLAWHPGRAGIAALLTGVSWIGNVGWVAVGLVAFDLPSSAQVATVALAVLMAGITVAPTPGFFGSFEASMVVALLPYGASAAVAAACALFCTWPGRSAPRPWASPRWACSGWALGS